MKIKDEQKEVLKSVTKKAAGKLVADVKSAEAKSIKRPLVILLLVVAAVGVLRDPMSLVIGLLAAVAVAFVMSTSAEDLHKLTSSLQSKEEKPSEEKESEKK